MSDTPSTDAVLRNAPRHPLDTLEGRYLVTPAPDLLDLARQLEREADTLKAENERLRKALERAVPALWIVATSGNADAVAIHAEARAALGSKT